ncbi:hypothetical protein CBL_05573 [Carabus blaptoides fortunei]
MGCARLVCRRGKDRHLTDLQLSKRQACCEPAEKMEEGSVSKDRCKGRDRMRQRRIERKGSAYIEKEEHKSISIAGNSTISHPWSPVFQLHFHYSTSVLGAMRNRTRTKERKKSGEPEAEEDFA